jgi:hypothetical protein
MQRQIIQATQTPEQIAAAAAMAANQAFKAAVDAANQAIYQVDTKGITSLYIQLPPKSILTISSFTYSSYHNGLILITQTLATTTTPSFVTISLYKTAMSAPSLTVNIKRAIPDSNGISTKVDGPVASAEVCSSYIQVECDINGNLLLSDSYYLRLLDNKFTNEIKESIISTARQIKIEDSKKDSQK